MSAPSWLTVKAAPDVERARRLAREVAVAQGLDRVAAEEVVLAVSELATNLVRYARGGELLVRALEAKKVIGRWADRPGAKPPDGWTGEGSVF